MYLPRTFFNLPFSFAFSLWFSHILFLLLVVEIQKWKFLRCFFFFLVIFREHLGSGSDRNQHHRVSLAAPVPSKRISWNRSLSTRFLFFFLVVLSSSKFQLWYLPFGFLVCDFVMWVRLVLWLVGNTLFGSRGLCIFCYDLFVVVLRAGIYLYILFWSFQSELCGWHGRGRTSIAVGACLDHQPQVKQAKRKGRPPIPKVRLHYSCHVIAF